MHPTFPDADWASSARVAHRLRALGAAGTVLQLGAHPDDEESAVLALLALGDGARVVYWSATRGEGGQNKRGPERADALGVLRTWESLDARSVDGAEVLYGPFIDFGFSKNGEDALRRWGREEVTREIVRAIRLVQPLVVIGRWSGTAGDGHGHHQAIGMVTADALDAAADSAAFPDLGLPAWTVAKVYRSLGGDWQPGEDAEFGIEIAEFEAAGHLRVDTGGLDPISGRSYQELSHLAMNRHRSQGMGFVPEPGAHLYYFRRERPAPAAGEPRETGFYDGVDAGLTALATAAGERGAKVEEALRRAAAAATAALELYRPHEPWNATPPLLEGVEVLRALEAASEPGSAVARWLRRRAEAFEQTASMCLALRLHCDCARARVTPGSETEVRVRLHDWGPEPAEVLRLRVSAPPGWHVKESGPGVFCVAAPADAEPHSPYWTREPHGPYRYEWPENVEELGEAFDAPLVVAEADVRVGQATLTLRAPAVQRSGYTGGARALPLTVVPPVALVPRQRRVILPVSSEDTVLECDVVAQCIEPSDETTTLGLAAPDGWTVEPAGTELHLRESGDSQTVRFRVTVPAGAGQAAHELRYDGVELNAVRLAGPGAFGPADDRTCVAEANLVSPAALAVQLVDVEFVRTLRYGYVRGMEEEVPEALGHFGLDLSDLDDDVLAYGDLHNYDALVIGPNAYHLRGEVRRQAGRLLDYVAEGGTLVVQYQGYGYDAPGLAPHPFRFHQPHDRVTDPQAPIEVVDPAHPLLHAPNAIVPADFEGWVHDRGLYFFGEWDRRYTPVLASHDLGEEPRAGGLMVAAHGRGTYVYAGYSFFRQLPAGVPGAIRLFANLLGLAEVRVRERMERLRRLELFEFMSDEQLYAAARIVSERWIDAGTTFARQGTAGQHLFVLVDGSVEVVKELAAGERVLHVASPGESLGELALLAGIPRSASLRTRTDATVLVLHAEAFDAWLERHPDLGRRLLRVLARKVVSRDPDG